MGTAHFPDMCLHVGVEVSLEEIVSSYKINQHKANSDCSALNPIFEHIGDKVLNVRKIVYF